MLNDNKLFVIFIRSRQCFNKHPCSTARDIHISNFFPIGYVTWKQQEHNKYEQ